MTGMPPLPPLVQFWFFAVLVSWAGWCVFTALTGLKTEARWPIQVAYYTGLIMIVVLSTVVLLLASWGMMQVTVGVMG